ncbi:MAG: glycoside hydrolase family 88 protein [Ignavibacteria bacterium]|jgi:rhamnogalacturonyl hydrolase YesR
MKDKFLSYILVIVTSSLLIVSCVQKEDSRTPSDIVKAVADKILRETVFEFKQVIHKPRLNMQMLDYKNGYGFAGNGVYYSLSNLKCAGDTTLTFGTGYSGVVKIWVNGSPVFEGSNDEPVEVKEIAYGLFEFPDTFDVNVKKGLNEILIKLVSLNEYPKVYLREITEEQEAPHSAEFVLENSSEEFELKWMSIGTFPQLTNVEESAAFKYPPEEKFKDYYEFDGEIYAWNGGRKNILCELVIKPDNSYQRESYLEWHYANGTVMSGMLAVADKVGGNEYKKFVNKFCDFTIENYDYFEWQYKTLNALRGTNHRIYRKSMLDDTGSPALPFVQLYMEKENESYKKIIDEMFNYVVNGQVRLDDGTLCRPEPVEMTVWADDLFMSVPFLIRMAKITGDEKYYDDAALQVVKFYDLLFDEEAGLNKHGWFDNKKERSIAFWGRANGWMIWATSEALLNLPHNHPSYSKILELFEAHIEGVAKYQAESGLWHQVLDHPESFEETSCTSMYLLGMIRGVQNGWLDGSFKDNIEKAWKGLKTKIKDDGTVIDICRGTGIGYDLEFYYNRKRFDNDPRGLGAVLTAVAEMHTFENN